MRSQNFLACGGHKSLAVFMLLLFGSSDFTRHAKGPPFTFRQQFQHTTQISSKVQRGDPLHFSKYSQVSQILQRIAKGPPFTFRLQFQHAPGFPAKCKGGTLCTSTNIHKSLTFYRELQRVPPLHLAENSLQIAPKSFFRMVKTIKNALKHPKIVFFGPPQAKKNRSQINF